MCLGFGAKVAPHVGAWIETYSPDGDRRIMVSLPTWERGLKRLLGLALRGSPWSPPTWERGLKLAGMQGRKLGAYRRSPRGSVD